MIEDMNTSELLVEKTEQNLLREILIMIKESRDLKELEDKVKLMLKTKK